MNFSFFLFRWVVNVEVKSVREFLSNSFYFSTKSTQARQEESFILFLIFFNRLKLFMRRWWKFQMCCLTYSLTSRNLSPSLATHRPRLLITEPLKVIGCCSPDWNHEPFHCEGKTQFVADAEMNKEKIYINFLEARMKSFFWL